MRKGQSTIIEVGLITGIIIAVVTATVIWGRPLIEKSTDKAHIDNVIAKMKEVDSAVRYVGNSRSSLRVNLGLDSGEEIRVRDGTVLWETSTRIPIIAVNYWVPLSGNQLPTKKNLTNINTTTTCTDCPTLTGYQNPQKGTGVFNNTEYQITVYNSTSQGAYTLLCMNNTDLVRDSDCATQFNTITKNGVEYTVGSIQTDGSSAVIMGEDIDNVGVVGRDPAGVVIGKSVPSGDYQEVLIKLDYRPLKDNLGRKISYVLECDSNCEAGQGEHSLNIRFDSMDTRQTGGAGETEIVLKLSFD